MKRFKYSFVFLIFLSFIFIQCQDDDDNGNAIYQDQCNDGIQNGDETGVDCGGSKCPPCEVGELFAGEYVQEDQMGRPAINLLFNQFELRDSLNKVEVHQMKGLLKEVFKQQLMKMDTSYTTNILNLDAEQMAGLFSSDVLWVSASGNTLYGGWPPMTGRTPGEDVMDDNLLWIFGGPDGTKNNEDPLLISDGVDGNDAEFLNHFPYLAPPFQ
ncbi:MAG TPA: DUF4331 family protein [Flavobacteriaceae bacterium]|nr:DUF4331 family protein [Flavobacteriaceae bacterium]